MKTQWTGNHWEFVEIMRLLNVVVHFEVIKLTNSVLSHYCRIKLGELVKKKALIQLNTHCLPAALKAVEDYVIWLK